MSEVQVAIAVAKNSTKDVHPTPLAPEVYIPPSGIAFRLLGYTSQCVIFSRTQEEPQVGQHGVQHGVFTDQWFTLLRNESEHPGLYAIKGRKTGKVLYSSAHDDPRVWHVDGDGEYQDDWFKFVPGQGQYSKYFRLLTPSQNVVLFLRTDKEPYLYNYPANGAVFSDQHFTFIWEDMKVDKVEYDLDAGRIISSTPITLAEQTLTNDSNQDQEMSFSVNKSITNSTSFEYSTGFTVTVGMEFSVGIPLITEGKFSIEASSTNTWTWGETTQYTTEYTATFPVKAGPHEKVRAVSMVNQGVLDVPYTLYMSSKSSGVTVETTGTWRGVSSWDLRHTISHIKISD